MKDLLTFKEVIDAILASLISKQITKDEAKTQLATVELNIRNFMDNDHIDSATGLDISFEVYDKCYDLLFQIQMILIATLI